MTGKRTRTMGLIAGAAVLVGLLAAFGTGWIPSAGSQGGATGYVDVVLLTEEYLRPRLDDPLAEETARLQAEFDAEADGLSEAEMQALFQDYQTRLDAIKQSLIDEQLPLINDAIARVAQETGVEIVVEKQVVLYGGADLTDSVLEELISTLGPAGE